MSEHAITRRSFLAGSAGVAAAIAGSEFLSFGSWQQAYAEEAAGPTTTAHSLCNACSTKCGFTAYVVDGKLDKIIGDASHPYCEGTLCARGYGYADIAYSADRLTDPLKKNESGQFQAISWEQAYAEIGEKVQSIIKESGPETLAIVQDPRPSGKYYSQRFMNALGSPNVYTHGVACNMSKNSGFAQVIGASDYTSDVENSKMTMFIGRSYADAIRPSALHALEKAHEAGAYIVLVDPRLNNSIAFADEWVPINPGTDLAFILGMAHVLVSKGLYDKDYVAANSMGFDEWASYLQNCTPEWAQEITGIDANTIERLATTFAEAAPAASIEPSWRGAFGCSYDNSGETARAVCAFNTLLGCWNQKGGALFLPSVSAGKLDAGTFPSVPKPEGTIVGAKEYPLSQSGMGVSVFAANLATTGMVRGMFFYNSNMVAGYSNPEHLKECVEALDLSVAIDVQMSETCMACQYVLPDTSYLERLELPEFVSAKTPVVTLRDKVIEKVHPNTRPVDQIFSELAEACGVGEYFTFSVEELADAQLASVGLSLDALRQKGTAAFPEKTFEYGKTPEWKTPTGKIQFASDACEKAGLPRVPQWREPAVSVPDDGASFRLIGGKQAIQSHTQTANIEALMDITKQYGLDRVWMNANRAAELGIADGDTVLVSNDLFSGQAQVKVTERINPEALYLPSHYGCSSPQQKTAYNVGLRQMDFVPYRLEEGYGGACTQETFVTVKKVGA